MVTVMVTVSDDFEDGSLGTALRPRYAPDGTPNSSPNTVFSAVTSSSGGSGPTHVEFVAGRTGQGVTRATGNLGGSNTMSYWLPGYEPPLYEAPAIVEPVTASAWYRIEDQKTKSTYNVMELRSDNEGAFIRSVFNPFSTKGSAYATISGVSMAHAALPLGAWVKHALTYDPAAGLARVTLTREDLTVVLDTGDQPIAAGIVPTHVNCILTNSPPTVYTLDDFEITHPVEEAPPLAISGQVGEVRRRFMRPSGQYW